jgi:hypothetical protein
MRPLRKLGERMSKPLSAPVDIKEEKKVEPKKVKMSSMLQ